MVFLNESQLQQKRKPRKKEEEILQNQIVSYLSFYARKYNFIYFAPMNEMTAMLLSKFKVSMQTIAMINSWMGKMGFIKGVSDLVIGHNGKMYCIELKSKTGKQRKTQSIFQANAERTNIDYVLIRSLKQLQDKMYEWGIIC